jgi:hypothetical protein
MAPLMSVPVCALEKSVTENCLAILARVYCMINRPSKQYHCDYQHTDNHCNSKCTLDCIITVSHKGNKPFLFT